MQRFNLVHAIPIYSFIYTRSESQITAFQFEMKKHEQIILTIAHITAAICNFMLRFFPIP